jgi:uncharacterized protein (DUF1697 family)
MTTRIALLRGINVGRAKRVPMAELRGLLEELGFTDVRTLLNSGNAVFEAGRKGNRAIASAIETAISSQFGFEVPVVVLSGKELDAIIAENPLTKGVDEPAKLHVAFVKSATALGKSRPLLKEQWNPEAIALGTGAAYLWYADGVLESKLAPAFARAMGDAATSRNWSTVLKLRDAVGADS